MTDSLGHRLTRIHLNRRTTLFGATSLATLGVMSLSGSSSSARSAAKNSIVLTEERYSRQRGQPVDIVYRLPRHTSWHRLPMVLLLHGRGLSAQSAGPGGMVSKLGDAVAEEDSPPFGFVAVDGGDTYWHEHDSGDDPMGMLLEELPGWLRARGFGDHEGTPFAAMGLSMGGFGALLYARRRAERREPMRAVGALAPALMPWARMRKRDVWHSRRQWISMDPLHNIRATRDTPTGIWCGLDDPFVKGARAFIERAEPEVAYLAPGGHDDRFFRSVTPSLLGFLGAHAPRRNQPLTGGR